MSHEFIDSNIRGNRVQSALLILGMACLLSLMGYLIGGTLGLVIAVVVCLLALVFGPRVSPQIVLRMYKTQPISRATSPELFDMFQELVRRAELDVAPSLHYVPSRTLNAFAVGHADNAAVAITDGLLRILNPREIAGVLAHELSHIRHRDMWVLGIADSVSRITATLSQIGQFMLLFALPLSIAGGGYVFLISALVLVFAPLISNLMQLALSRSREFNADLGAVRITKDAIGLSSALSKLERATSSDAGAPWIFAGRRRTTVPAMLRTHPPTDQRIERIMEAGRSIGQQFPIGENQVPARRRVQMQQHPRVRSGPRWHVAGLWY
tara:strand:+ start:203613 stop:204587 length:975 start_codon:yes stop_codon:yes gene_type:complete